MLGKIEGKRRRERQRMTKHHRLNGYESEQTLRDSEGQGSLTWVCKKSDKTLGVNSNKVVNIKYFLFCF